MIAEKFSNYFTGIAQNLSAEISIIKGTCTNYLKPPSINYFAMNLTSSEELLELNNTLKLTHSSGPDHLDPTRVNPNFSVIAALLADVINCWLQTGIVGLPANMKELSA